MHLLTDIRTWYQAARPELMNTTTNFATKVAQRALSATNRIRRGFRGWAFVAGCVVTAGFLISLVWATGIAHNDDARVRQSFETSALGISAALQASIQHEEDLVVAAGAFVAANQGATSAQLGEWIVSVRAQERYPELLGIGSLAFVRNADLDAFKAALEADPAVPLSDTGELSINPPGVRPFYCLLHAIVSFAPRDVAAAAAAASPFGLDYCAGDLGPLLLAGRDSGTSSIFAVPDVAGTLFVIQTPIYRGGLVPDSVPARRAAYLGILGTSIAPDVLLSAVSPDNSDFTITLTHDGLPSASFSDGDVPTDAESLREDLGNGWTATISRPTPDRGLIASDSAKGLLAAGIAASVMLGLLIYALGTGRRRAIRLVASRTDELRYQALHDSLTGLPNRAMILDRVEQLLARSRRNGTSGAALYIDVDSFKSVNDTLGHDAGDQLLRSVAARLTSGLRDVDTIGRMGGDEFVVLVDGGPSAAGPQIVAARLLEIIREPFDIDLSPRPLAVTTSVGIATSQSGTAVDLLRDADIALYAAKAGGRDCFQTFRPDMEAEVQHQYALESELRTALEAGQFRLCYQPIYDLSDLTIIGVEALIRWEHPSRGTLQPAEFLPALEASGQIVEVGRWVLGEACRQAKEWLDRGGDLTMAVNISARQLERDTIVEHVAEALALNALDPARLTIEISESTLMRDTKLAAQRLTALKQLGVELAVDDLGTTGYSSLAYLQRFPVDCIKIDRSFINTIASSAESAALIHTLVQIGKNLGLKTLAEGVETTDELDHLREFDVDLAQGFLLARPLSAEAVATQLMIPGLGDELAIQHPLV
jgi:diguanylate cyclase (GGDEF)-like protein